MQGWKETRKADETCFLQPFSWHSAGCFHGQEPDRVTTNTEM